MYNSWSIQEFDKISFDTDASEQEYKQINRREGGDAGYIQARNSFKINEILRAGRMPDGDDRKTIETLDSLIARNTLPQDTRLYRMVEPNFIEFATGKPVQRSNYQDVLNDFIGTKIVDKGYLSASAVEEHNVFLNRAIRININAKAGTNAFVTLNSWESEVIFPRGSSLKIKSVREDGFYFVLECDLLTPE